MQIINGTGVMVGIIFLEAKSQTNRGDTRSSSSDRGLQAGVGLLVESQRPVGDWTPFSYFFCLTVISAVCFMVGLRSLFQCEWLLTTKKFCNIYWHVGLHFPTIMVIQCLFYLFLNVKTYWIPGTCPSRGKWLKRMRKMLYTALYDKLIYLKINKVVNGTSGQ